MTSLTDSDDWHASFRGRLNKTKLYKEFLSRESKDDYFVHLNASLLTAIEYAVQRSKLVVRVLPQFTLHDADHLFGVLNNMGLLMSDETIEKLGIVDLYLLMICAFFHDLGLAPTKREIDSWRNSLTNNYSPKSAPKESISNFISARPEALKALSRFDRDKEYEKLSELEDRLISAYIRETHGVRLPDVIGKYKESNLKYRNFDLSRIVSEICESHVRDPIHIQSMENLIACGNGAFFCPPFVAVILRLADLLDFDMKRTPNVLFDSMGIEDPTSTFEWLKHRSIIAWHITPSLIRIRASCKHPAIEAGIKEFCEYVDQELVQCGLQLKLIHDPHQGIPQHYKQPLPPSVDTSGVGPEKQANGTRLYSYSPTRFTLDKNKVIDLLMGTSLYGNPAVALRELLQNSFDACLSRRAFELAWSTNYKPSVSIIFERSGPHHRLTVKDNGMGMDEEIVQHFYSKVGASYYKSADFYALLATNGVEYTSISRFGIGVLSYFLVANSLSVYSRRKTGKNAISTPVLVRVDGVNGVFWISETKEDEIGTETTLDLLPTNPWRNLSAGDLVAEVKAIVPEPPFPIDIVVDGETTSYSGETSPPEEIWKSSTRVDTQKKAAIRNKWISVEDKKKGYALEANVFWLESRGRPVLEHLYFEKTITIENQPRPLVMSNSLESRTNKVTDWSTSLGSSGDEVVLSRAYDDFLESELKLCLHGFDVPFEPFSEVDSKRFGCILKLPFVLRGRLMVRSPSDLSLNAARDKVLSDKLWFELKMWLLTTLVEETLGSLSKEQRKMLAKVWSEASKDETLDRVIAKYVQ